MTELEMLVAQARKWIYGGFLSAIVLFSIGMIFLRNEAFYVYMFMLAVFICLLAWMYLYNRRFRLTKDFQLYVAEIENTARDLIIGLGIVIFVLIGFAIAVVGVIKVTSTESYAWIVIAGGTFVYIGWIVLFYQEVLQVKHVE